MRFAVLAVLFTVTVAAVPHDTVTHKGWWPKLCQTARPR